MYWRDIMSWWVMTKSRCGAGHGVSGTMGILFLGDASRSARIRMPGPNSCSASLSVCLSFAGLSRNRGASP